MPAGAENAAAARRSQHSGPQPRPGRTIRLSVPAWVGKERLDRALARMVPAVSRSFLKKLAKDGSCLVNGDRADPRDTVRPGDVVEIRLPRAIEPPCRPVEGPLVVRYEDEHVLVVDKPAGTVSHPAKGHVCDTLMNWVVAHLMDEIQRGWARPHMMTRLDKDTSGLVLISKTPQAHRALQRQLERRQIRRRYAALAWGDVQPRQGVWDKPLSPLCSGARVKATPRGRPSMTAYRVRRVFVLATDVVAPGCPAAMSLVEASLGTGRSHQIRVHFAEAGYPLVGDMLYGPCQWNRPPHPGLAAAIGGLGGQALHAERIEFTHPVTASAVAVTSPTPQAFAELLQWLEAHSRVEEDRSDA